MELIIVFGLLITLALAAPRWGRDSRAGLGSKEQDLAAAGVRWPVGPSRELPTALDSARGPRQLAA